MSEHTEIGTPDEVVDVIDEISNQLERNIRLGRLTEKIGGIYECSVFELRSYCWCDGSKDGHEEYCPPNFKWRDFEVFWYKYLGRGTSQNRTISREELMEMRQECLESLKD